MAACRGNLPAQARQTHLSRQGQQILVAADQDIGPASHGQMQERRIERIAAGAWQDLVARGVGWEKRARASLAQAPVAQPDDAQRKLPGRLDDDDDRVQPGLQGF